MSNEIIVNKVALSALTTINLEDYYPTQPIVAFDLQPYLYMGLILREKEFRQSLKDTDLTPYHNAIVALHCSTEAIIPVWAYMLVAATLKPIANNVMHGSVEAVTSQVIINNLHQINRNTYEGQRIVIKGCGDKHISEAVYVTITTLLQPVVKSIMYGEPCSTVPVYKNKLAN